LINVAGAVIEFTEKISSANTLNTHPGIEAIQGTSGTIYTSRLETARRSSPHKPPSETYQT